MTAGVSTCRHCGERIVWDVSLGEHIAAWTHESHPGVRTFDLCRRSEGVAEPIEEDS